MLVTRTVKKPGGFPPKPPGKPTYDDEGFYSDEYNCKLVAYKARYKQWEKYLKPLEEVFGVPFYIEDEPDYNYLRKRKLGLIEPIKIEYKEGQHPADEVFD